MDLLHYIKWHCFYSFVAWMVCLNNLAKIVWSKRNAVLRHQQQAMIAPSSMLNNSKILNEKCLRQTISGNDKIVCWPSGHISLTNGIPLIIIHKNRIAKSHIMYYYFILFFSSTARINNRNDGGMTLVKIDPLHVTYIQHCPAFPLFDGTSSQLCSAWPTNNRKKLRAQANKTKYKKCPKTMLKMDWMAKITK